MSTNLTDERLPVWEALSEFFLDTELDETDHERIARVRQALADNRLVSVAVLVVTTALILAGIWFVRGQQGTAAGAMSEVTLSAEQSAKRPRSGPRTRIRTGRGSRRPSA